MWRGRASAATAVVDSALRNGRISQAEFDLLAPRLYRTGDGAPSMLASTQDLLALGDLGRKILLESSWEGVKVLTPAADDLIGASAA